MGRGRDVLRYLHVHFCSASIEYTSVCSQKSPNTYSSLRSKHIMMHLIIIVDRSITRRILNLSRVLIVDNTTITLAELLPHFVFTVGGESFTIDRAGLVECSRDASRVSCSVATALTATHVCVSLASCEALSTQLSSHRPPPLSFGKELIAPFMLLDGGNSLCYSCLLVGCQRYSSFVVHFAARVIGME